MTFPIVSRIVPTPWRRTSSVKGTVLYSLSVSLGKNEVLACGLFRLPADWEFLMNILILHHIKCTYERYFNKQ